MPQPDSPVHHLQTVLIMMIRNSVSCILFQGLLIMVTGHEVSQAQIAQAPAKIVAIPSPGTATETVHLPESAMAFTEAPGTQLPVSMGTGLRTTKPIYVSVQEKAPPHSQDEITTKEFVIKNRKAAELYDRISRVGKLLNVELRLDPARNSITAKGAAKHLSGIKSILATLDIPGKEKENPGRATIEPKKTAPPVQQNTPIPQERIPGRMSRTPEKPLSSQGPIGKYQMSAVGNNIFLLDTTTGNSWFLDTGGDTTRWIPLPHPEKN